MLFSIMLVASTIDAQIELDASTPSNVGECDGTIDIIADGSAGPFSFQWEGPNGFTSTEEDIEGLCAGNYTVSVYNNYTDCETIIDTYVSVCQPINIGTSQQGVCYDAYFTPTLGYIHVYPSGGGNFQYLWNDGATVQHRDNLSIGEYCLTVTDGNTGCYSTECFDIGDGPEIFYSASSSCAQIPGNGSISLTVEGGTPPYTYYWNSNSTVAGEDGSSVENATAGIHSVTVADNNGCYKAISMFVYALSDPDFTADIEPSCPDIDNGSIVLETLSGNDLGWEYLWSDGNTSRDRYNLAPGTYCVSITNHYDCLSDACFTVGEVNEMSVDFDITDACPDAPFHGDVSFTISGGVAPYTVSINLPGSINIISGIVDESNSYIDINLKMAATTYNYTITDDKGCEISGTFTIGTSNPLTTQEITNTYDCGIRYFCNGEEVTALYEEGETELRPNPDFCQYLDLVCLTTDEVMQPQVQFRNDLEFKFDNNDCEVEIFCPGSEHSFNWYTGDLNETLYSGSTQDGFHPDDATLYMGTWYWCNRIRTCEFGAMPENNFEPLTHDLPSEWIYMNQIVAEYDELCDCMCGVRYIYCDENGNGVYDPGTDELLNSFKNCAGKKDNLSQVLNTRGALRTDGTNTTLNIVQSIYPNPFTEQINIEIQSAQKDNLLIEIYNVLNERIYQAEHIVDSAKNLIQITPDKNLPDGIYQINVKDSSGKQSSHKIVHIGQK